MMNYLVVGQHRYNSADSWREHLVFSSNKELTDEELERKFYMYWVYKFSEECDGAEDGWTEDDYIEFFEENLLFLYFLKSITLGKIFIFLKPAFFA